MSAATRIGNLAGIAVLLVAVGCANPNPRVETKLNADAALLGELPVNPMGWRVITSSIHTRFGTMETLFGNDAAIESARSGQQNYPAGAVLAAVTWSQQEDPRWFGGRIPSAPISVEFVTQVAGADGKSTHIYEKYGGRPLQKLPSAAADANRAEELLTQRAAAMP